MKQIFCNNRLMQLNPATRELPASFLTTALTLSRIRKLVLNEERLMADLLIARKELELFRGEDSLQ